MDVEGNVLSGREDGDMGMILWLTTLVVVIRYIWRSMWEEIEREDDDK